MPMFSAVIALYNKEDYIEETVKSALRQKSVDLEVILVDDGSTDAGVSRLAKIADPRLKIFRQKNAGVSAARNRAIAEASGEWIAFLDADDLWSDRYLQNLSDLIGNSDPSIHAVATGFHAGMNAQKFASLPKRETTAGDLDLIDDLCDEWMRRTLFFTSSIAVRRCLLISMQPCFSPGESHGEDIELWIKLSKETSVLFNRIPLVFYRQNTSNSLNASNGGIEPAPYLRRLVALCNQNGWSGPRRRSVRRFVSHQLVTVARQNIVEQKRVGAMRHLGDALPAGFLLPRWWVTLLMMVAPKNAVHRWQAWRVRRGIYL